MYIKALVPSYGCKRMQGKGIVEVIGSHTAFWDLFCCSCAVTFAKPKCRMEILNDLHGGIVNLMRVVQHDQLVGELFYKLVRTGFCQAIYKDSIEWLKKFRNPNIIVNEPDTDWAYHYLIASWMGRNGFVGTDKELNTGFCRRFTSNGGDPSTRFRTMIKSVPWWWERLAGATIIQEDSLRLIDLIEDKAGTVVYADPPYIEKKAKYAHDFTEKQHEILAIKLRRFAKTRVVVSYYAHSLLTELYVNHGFRLIERTMSKQLSNGTKTALEVLLVKN